MIGGGSKKDHADMANDLKQHEEEMEIRRQREQDELQRMTNEYHQRRAALNSNEVARLEALDKEQDEKFKFITEKNQESREADRIHFDQLQSRNETATKQAIEYGNALLDRERNMFQTDMKNKQTDHQNMMIREENKNKEAEEKIETKVVDLKNQKEKSQKELHNDQKEYFESKQRQIAQHAFQIEGLVEKTAQLELEREEDESKHELHKKALKEHSENGMKTFLLAKSYDRKENMFSDNVSNTRKCATDLSNAVSAMSRYVTKLRQGGAADEKFLTCLERLLDNVRAKKDILQEACASILGAKETNNQAVLDCQAIARKIVASIDPFDEALLEFDDSLQDIPITNARETFKKVTASGSDLTKLAFSFPSIPKTEYAVEAIFSNSRSLASGNLYIEQTSTSSIHIESNK